MSDRRLQVFHAVARQLSFTKAAEDLNMTQPAVTFQIRQLEEDFNTRLFDRGHNKINLTEAGQKVYKYSIQIFEIYDEMKESIGELTGGHAGIIYIGASTTIAEYLLPALLGGFKQKFPEINIHLKVSNTDAVVKMVEENNIDLGFVEGFVNNKLLLVEKCSTDHLVAVMPKNHKLATKKSVSVKDLAKEPFIFREHGSGTREVISDYLQKHGASEEEMNSTMVLGSPEAVKGAIEAGMGVSIASCVTIYKELQLGTLDAVRLQDSLERPFSIVRQRHKFKIRLMEELLSYSLEYCRTHQQFLKDFLP